ncbi:hypothetical protein C8J56DRAFT_779396 [Mycena floridula]|nr:hypothetical protein C8J56DRAFT_779396 [Mycena floridula]
MYCYSTILFLSCPPTVRRPRRMYLIIGAMILALITVVVFTDGLFIQFMFIDNNRDPLGYLAANSSVWWQTMGTGANQLANLLGEGLLIFRCYIIWNSDWRIIVFPLILYLASMSMAITMLIQSAKPGSNFFRGSTVNFGILWAVMSVALNIVVTGLIAVRIFRARNASRKFIEDREGEKMYTNIAAIIIESALPFSLFGIVFAVTYGKDLAEGPAFLFVWAVFSGLSPQFIIFRVACGSTVVGSIVTGAATSLAFCPDDASATVQYGTDRVTFPEPDVDIELGSTHTSENHSRKNV